jgi:hypothetical protein
VKPAAALQATLAAEHAAVHVYAVLGGRLAGAENPATAERFRAAYETHRGRRDQLRSLIADSGATPEAAAAAYQVDARGRDHQRLLRVARQTEERCAAVYAQLVAGSTGRNRRWAIEALTDAALRHLELGGVASAYPGLPELG